MTLEEYKDVLQLYKLANNWIEDYTQNNIGEHSAKFKKQYKEMQQLLIKTKQLIDKQSGEAGEDMDVEDLQEKIIKLAEGTAPFAACFGNMQIAFDSSAPVSKETTALAIELRQLTATWYGKYSDTSQDHNTVSLMASIYEQAKKLIAAPKTLDGDQMSIIFYGSQSRDSKRMRRNIGIIQDDYKGLLNIELHEIEDEDKDAHKLKIENYPATIFKRGAERVAKHEGYISISALQQKVAILATGSNFSDSTSIKSIKDLKSINQKELYSMNEHLLFYFIIHDCGHSKRTTTIVEPLSQIYHNVKFEQIKVDKSHHLHTSFGVNEVPALVFVHDGKVVGKHTGYIEPTKLERLLEQFANSNKKNIGYTTSGEVTIIDQYLGDPEKGRKIQDKQASDEDKMV